jgi:hypothetical protein
MECEMELERYKKQTVPTTTGKMRKAPWKWVLSVWKRKADDHLQSFDPNNARIETGTKKKGSCELGQGEL